MGGLTGVLVRRSRDPQSHRPRPLRVGIRRRHVAVERYVTEVVLDDGEVVAGERSGRRGVFDLAAPGAGDLAWAGRP